MLPRGIVRPVDASLPGGHGGQAVEAVDGSESATDQPGCFNEAAAMKLWKTRAWRQSLENLGNLGRRDDARVSVERLGGKGGWGGVANIDNYPMATDILLQLLIFYMYQFQLSMSPFQFPIFAMSPFFCLNCRYLLCPPFLPRTNTIFWLTLFGSRSENQEGRCLSRISPATEEEAR